MCDTMMIHILMIRSRNRTALLPIHEHELKEVLQTFQPYHTTVASLVVEAPTIARSRLASIPEKSRRPYFYQI